MQAGDERSSTANRVRALSDLGGSQLLAENPNDLEAEAFLQPCGNEGMRERSSDRRPVEPPRDNHLASFISLMIALSLALAVAPALGDAPASDPQALEREAKQIEAMLIAPCCWTQQVSLHQSPEAKEIKANIRRMLAAGKTRQQILDAYVAKYGLRILVEPPAHGFNVALYVAPWLFLACGVGFVVFVIKRLRSPGAATLPSERAGAPEDETLSKRIDEERRMLD
jgi:cytochrome c-type biogenesis protein CcmH